jgi:hypothetical protein
VVHILEETFGPSSVRLAGSRRDGLDTANSDFDLLVSLDQLISISLATRLSSIGEVDASTIYTLQNENSEKVTSIAVLELLDRLLSPQLSRKFPKNSSTFTLLTKTPKSLCLTLSSSSSYFSNSLLLTNFDIVPIFRGPSGLVFIPAGRRSPNNWSVCFAVKHQLPLVKRLCRRWKDARNTIRLIKFFVQSKSLPLSSTTILSVAVRTAQFSRYRSKKLKGWAGVSLMVNTLIRELLSRYIAHHYTSSSSSYNLISHLTITQIDDLVKQFQAEFVPFVNALPTSRSTHSSRISIDFIVSIIFVILFVLLAWQNFGTGL